ncbi:MAG: hypothetical protein B6I38_07065 [Anaerolineaceae bacterium 4572_5.1]|nr:MAG: hypothetical protein B5M51_04750 [Anaerolinea sp. 4484_236]OQY30649.1 MAG: hypothetical protein B6I38_07065 [Anaerolineaceae bacterium 4572_5.1]
MSFDSFDAEQDCLGLSCPMVLLKTRSAMKKLEVAQVLKMVTTDPNAVLDVEAWTSGLGHELLGCEQDGDIFTFFIRKNR